MTTPQEIIDTFQQKYIGCMRDLYPDGLDWVKQRRQHRDLIRTFTMGWIEALLLFNARLAGQYLDALSHTSDLNWWPDDSWKWK